MMISMNYKKILLFLYLFNFSSITIFVATSRLEERILKQSTLHGGILSAKQKAKLTKKIKKKVREEIRIQQQKKMRKIIKDRLAGRITDKNAIKFIYKIPKWPFEAIFYGENNLFDFEFKVHGATKSYSSSGHTDDLSQLVFGKKQFKLQDILLASKLLKEGKISAPTSNFQPDPNDPGFVMPGSQYHYFYILADQPIIFDASTCSQDINFKYARHFLNGDLSLAIEIPIKRTQNNLRLASEISSDLKSTLYYSQPSFYSFYSNLSDLIDTILDVQGVRFKKHETEWGFGDLKLSCHAELDTRQLERCLVGASLLFPTAGDSTINRLWAPELGNGGFVEFSVFTSALWGIHSCFNPHLFMTAIGSAPAYLDKRTPQIISYNGIDPTPGYGIENLLTLGNSGLIFNTNSFNEIDTIIPRFARESVDLKIHRGGMVFARFGNIIDHFFSSHASLDTFYDVRLKGKDYCASQQENEEFIPSYITQNTFQVAHRIGVNFLYQFNRRKRLSVEGLYTFAGRNVPQTYEGAITFSCEF